MKTPTILRAVAAHLRKRLPSAVVSLVHRRIILQLIPAIGVSQPWGNYHVSQDADVIVLTSHDSDHALCRCYELADPDMLDRLTRDLARRRNPTGFAALSHLQLQITLHAPDLCDNAAITASKITMSCHAKHRKLDYAIITARRGLIHLTLPYEASYRRDPGPFQIGHLRDPGLAVALIWRLIRAKKRAISAKKANRARAESLKVMIRRRGEPGTR